MRKNRKALLMILANVFIVVLALGFSSCRGANSVSNCFDLFLSTINSFQKHEEHNWEVEEILKKKTCTQDGIIEYGCTCGEVKTELEKASGHTYGAWEITANPTCLVDGEQKRECTVCFEETTQLIPKKGHSYEEMGEVDGEVGVKSYNCSLCGDTFKSGNPVLDGNETNEKYLADCATDFSFEIICAQDEAYIRENLKIIDAYFEGSEYENSKSVIVDYVLEIVATDTWKVSPVENYKEGYTYKAKRSNEVVFKDYGVQDITFSIAKEETTLMELKESVIFVQTLEDVNPGYYPYTKEYSESSETYWVTLGKTDGLEVNDIVCIGSARNIDDVLNADSDENLFGEIISIQSTATKGLLLELTVPDLRDLFENFDIYSTKMSPIIDAEFEEALKQEAIDSLYESDDFASFVAVSYQGIQSYLAKNNLTTTVNSTQKFLQKMEVKPTITPSGGEEVDSFEIGIDIDGHFSVPITKYGQSDESVGTITVSFNAGINMTVGMRLEFKLFNLEISNVENEEGISNNLDQIGFSYTFIQTVTTKFSFYVEITSDKTSTGQLKEEIKNAIKNGNLDEMVAQIKAQTKELHYDESMSVAKDILKKEALLKIPIKAGFNIVLNLDIYVEFDLYAAFNYEYKLVQQYTYGLRLTNRAMEGIFDKETLEHENEMTLAGYMYAEIGVIAHVDLASSLSFLPPKKFSVGIQAKVGVYTQAEGGIYWNFAGSDKDNVIAGNGEMGIHYDIDGVYKFFGLEEKTGATLHIAEGHVPFKTLFKENTLIRNEPLYYQGHCYRIFDNVCDTWEEAKEFCEARGGHLAIINSKEENDTIYKWMTSMGYKNAYFGLTDVQKEGEWVTVNGDKAPYTNWHDGEPNNNSGEDPIPEHYALLYCIYEDGTWNDGNFGINTYKDEKIFICEWKGDIA